MRPLLLQHLILAFCVLQPGLSWAGTTPPAQAEIRVLLFGQPCMLQGPQGAMDEATLKAIHSVSPEQLLANPPLGSSSQALDDLKAAVEKLKSQSKLPAFLDRYKERSLKRLDAQVAFFEGVTYAKKAQKTQVLWDAIKKYAKGKQVSELETMIKQLPLSKAPQLGNALDNAFDAYNELIEPDPEEDFHKAIRKVNVRYTCFFGDDEDGNGEGD